MVRKCCSNLEVTVIIINGLGYCIQSTSDDIENPAYYQN